MSRHVNIPIFIPHLGCPNQCVFCNQRTISGVYDFSLNSVENEIYMWLPEDLVRLELKTGRNKYISIDAGSAGQRTSAILTLLLQLLKQILILFFHIFLLLFVFSYLKHKIGR